MAQPWKEAFALAAVIQSVFAKGFRKRIARRGAYGGDAEIGTEPLAVSLRALPPLWRSVIRLVNASGQCGAEDGIGADHVEDVVVELRFLARTHVGQIALRRGCACNRAGGIRRGGRGLSFCQHWQGCEVRDYKQQEHKSAHLHFRNSPSANLRSSLHLKRLLPHAAMGKLRFVDRLSDSAASGLVPSLAELCESPVSNSWFGKLVGIDRFL